MWHALFEGGSTNRPVRGLTLAVLVLAAAGCGAQEIVIPERTPTPLDMATVGTVSGTVFFEGEPPERKPIRIGGFPACAGAHEEPPLDESVIVTAGRLRNVFVYIKEGLGDRVFAVPTEPVVMDQKGCIYSPHVAGVQVYQPVLFLNSDSLLHNVHSEPEKSKPFNFVMPVAGLERTTQYTAEEVAAFVQCDVHAWMGAYIGIVDHPYFAVSAADGTWSIGNLPPGDYILEAWHETYGTRTESFTLGPAGGVTLDLSYAAE
jgi:hypothetical protein